MGWERSRYGRDEDDSPFESHEDWPLGSSDEQRALAAPPDRDLTTTPLSASDLLIVPGDGVSMGAPFIRRRERPLSLRLAMVSLVIVILATGVFAASTSRFLVPPRAVSR